MRALDREGLTDAQFSARLRCTFCELYDVSGACVQYGHSESKAIVVEVIDLNDNGPIVEENGSATLWLEKPEKNLSSLGPVNKYSHYDHRT